MRERHTQKKGGCSKDTHRKRKVGERYAEEIMLAVRNAHKKEVGREIDKEKRRLFKSCIHKKLYLIFLQRHQDTGNRHNM